jgi:hypothetical protein
VQGRAREIPSFAVAVAALVVALGGTAVAAGEIAGSDAPETVFKLRVTTRPISFGDNRIIPFQQNVSFDVAAIC